MKFLSLIAQENLNNRVCKAIVEQSKTYVEKALTTQDLADLINALPSGKAVRLLSCNDLASAKDLSKLINGRTLLASDGWVDLFQDGSLASQNAFKKLVNGAETGATPKYNNYKPDMESQILGSFLDFQARYAKFTDYIKAIDPSTLKDAETTARMLNSYLKYLDKFRDLANDTRQIFFALNQSNPLKSGNVEPFIDDQKRYVVRVFQAPDGGGNYTDIYENGGFIVYRSKIASIDKTKK